MHDFFEQVHNWTRMCKYYHEWLLYNVFFYFDYQILGFWVLVIQFYFVFIKKIPREFHREFNDMY